MNDWLYIRGSVTKLYPYRKAMLNNVLCSVRLTDKDFAYLSRKLDKEGFQIDNHIVFSTEYCNYWLTDGRLYIGGEIVEF